MQAYNYHELFPSDPLHLKLLVYGVLVHEWVQTALSTGTAMDKFVYDFGNSSSLGEFHAGWFSVTIMTGMISVVVQTFFAWRICKLSTSRLWGGCIISLAAVQCVAAFVCGAMQRSTKFAYAIQGDLLIVSAVWLTGSLIVDILIAISMSILLLRSRTGVPRTDALINWVVCLVVETGILTASMAVLVLILAEVHPLRQTTIYETIVQNLTKFYAVTFLTNINSRARFRKHMEDNLVVELFPMSFKCATTPANEPSLETLRYTEEDLAVATSLGQRQRRNTIV